MDSSGVPAGLPLLVEKEASTDRHDIAEARGKNRLSICVGTLRNQDSVYNEVNNRSMRALQRKIRDEKRGKVCKV